MTWTCVLPYPPSVNHRLAPNKFGGWHKSTKAKAWEWQAINEIKKKAPPPTYPIQSRLGLCVRVYPPDKKKRDLDNILKSTCDILMTANLIEDDFSLHYLEVLRKETVAKGAIEIELWVLEPEKI